VTSATPTVPFGTAMALPGATQPPATGPRLSDRDFDRLREYVYQRTGIQFASCKRYFVDKRVHALMADYGTTEFSAYFSALRLGDEALVQKLVNSLTVNETYFLREDYQFDCLIRSVLPRVMADREAQDLLDKPVKILSLPSSTGEEPYSIAIQLLEEWHELDWTDVSITGGDIDTRVLDAARAGRYGERSLQRIPERLLRKYFQPVGEDTYQIMEDLRQSVDFRQMNVCDVTEMRSYQDYDVIFCRNLLIYFDELSCRTAVENLFGALRPGGYIFLGHSESMSRISPIFTPQRFPEGIVYQRPIRGGGR
jgi:chemotaxis protein methyltransferase CheR